MSKGYTENEALAKAYKAIEYKVMVQSSVLSYIDIFYILDYSYFAFLSSFDQKKGKKINPADAMH
jgi:DHA2 family multidrug resistance protein